MSTFFYHPNYPVPPDKAEDDLCAKLVGFQFQLEKGSIEDPAEYFKTYNEYWAMRKKREHFNIPVFFRESYKIDHQDFFKIKLEPIKWVR